MQTPKTGFLIQVGIPHVRTQIYQYRDMCTALPIRSFKNLTELKKPASVTAICKWAEHLERIVVLVKTSQCFNKSWNTYSLQKLLPKIIIVGTAAVGSDHIDFSFIQQKSIHFINTPGCNRFAVRDYVLMVLLKYALHIEKPLKDFHVGVIGCGNVGTEVSRTVLELGGSISVFDPYLQRNEIIKKIKKNNLANDQFGTRVFIHSTFDEFLYSNRLTVITLHVPFTEKSMLNKHPTHHLLNQKVLSKLTKLSIYSACPLLLINSSRGGIVHEKNLLPYLAHAPNQNPKHQNGMFYGADVWEHEPILNPQMVAKSFFATPHIAGYSLLAKQLAAKDLIEKIMSMLALKRNKKIPEFKANKTKLVLSPFLVRKYSKEKLLYENILLKLVERITGISAFHRALQNGNKENSLTLSERFLALRRKPFRRELREVELILPPKPFSEKTDAVMLEFIKLWKRVFNN